MMQADDARRMIEANKRGLAALKSIAARSPALGLGETIKAREKIVGGHDAAGLFSRGLWATKPHRSIEEDFAVMVEVFGNKARARAYGVCEPVRGQSTRILERAVKEIWA